MCLHGGTQNTNELLHNLIWERCSKTAFVGAMRLRLAVADATIVYNEGERGRLRIFQVLGLNYGEHLQESFNLLDSSRVQNAYIPGQKSFLKARQARPELRKSQAAEGTYGAGQF